MILSDLPSVEMTYRS